MDATLCFRRKAVKKQCRMHDPPPGNGPAAANTEGTKEGGTEVFWGSLREGLSRPANARQTLPGCTRREGRVASGSAELPQWVSTLLPTASHASGSPGRLAPPWGARGGRSGRPPFRFAGGGAEGGVRLRKTLVVSLVFRVGGAGFSFAFQARSRPLGRAEARPSRGGTGGRDALLRVRGGIFRAGKIPPCGGVGGIGRMRGLWIWIAGHSILRFAFRARRAGGGRARRGVARGRERKIFPIVGKLAALLLLLAVTPARAWAGKGMPGPDEVVMQRQGPVWPMWRDVEKGKGAPHDRTPTALLAHSPRGGAAGCRIPGSGAAPGRCGFQPRLGERGAPGRRTPQGRERGGARIFFSGNCATLRNELSCHALRFPAQRRASEDDGMMKKEKKGDRPRISQSVEG